MKIQPVSTKAVNTLQRMGKKGVAMAAGVCIGLAAGSIQSCKPNNISNDTFSSSTMVGQKGHEFKSLNDVKSEGKTKHLFAAQDGPDKGSRYYDSADYDFFGHYKQ